MYEIFEHTADLGLRVRAANPDELFADAARGLFSIMVANLAAVRTIEETPFQLHGDDLEELFHDWLAELLYTFHARRLVLAEFDVQIGSPLKKGTGSEPTSENPAKNDEREVPVPLFQWGLTATGRGEPIDPSRHQIDVEVKAITWHGLKVEQQSDGWLAEMIVDI